MKYKITLNGKIYEVEVEETEAVITNVTDAEPAPPATPTGASAPSVPAAPTGAAATKAPAAAAVPVAEGTKITSPMPGSILEVIVSTGQAVKAGDILLVLEAMKMENEIVASVDGIVTQVLVQKGMVVDTDAVLMVIG